MTAAAPLLEVRGLRVEFRRRRGTLVAVDDAALDVGAGEIVGLVGESGSGKSTLARAVLGLAPIAAGSVRFAGEDVTRWGFKQRRSLYRNMQMVFQDPYSSLNPSRPIGRTLAEPLEAFGERDRDAVRARVREMLARVHLPADASDRYPSEFSGGQRQRIAIARALMLSPQLVICDEAVSALDLSVQAQILDLLRELQADAGLSYLFISHDLDVVRQLCDRVVVLYRGRLMETGPAGRLAEAPAHPYTLALHRAAPLPNPRLQRVRREAAHAAKRASSAAADPPDEACAFAPRCAYALDRCRTERPAVRAADQGALVACHRWPEWRSGLAVAPGRVEAVNGSECSS
jgi:oligopeptide/dipeptide ABC transporter ATP-binding protein